MLKIIRSVCFGISMRKYLSYPAVFKKVVERDKCFVMPKQGTPMLCCKSLLTQCRAILKHKVYDVTQNDRIEWGQHRFCTFTGKQLLGNAHMFATRVGNQLSHVGTWRWNLSQWNYKLYNSAWHAQYNIGIIHSQTPHQKKKTCSDNRSNIFNIRHITPYEISI
jgi:hypothetical protein